METLRNFKRTPVISPDETISAVLTGRQCHKLCPLLWELIPGRQRLRQIPCAENVAHVIHLVRLKLHVRDSTGVLVHVGAT